MEILTLLSAGLAEAVMPINLAMIVLGVVLGLFIGMMPGLGSVNGVAILLPITFLVPPTSAIIFLAIGSSLVIPTVCPRTRTRNGTWQ